MPNHAKIRDLGPGRAFRIESESNPGIFYTLFVPAGGGEAVCSCPGFEITETCWHTRAARAVAVEVSA